MMNKGLALGFFLLGLLPAVGARADTGATKLCDDEWPRRHWFFGLAESRKLVPGTRTTINTFKPEAPPEPLIPYDPRRPMDPYDVAYEMFVPRAFPKQVSRAVGWYSTQEEALAAKQEVWEKHQPPNLMPLRTNTHSPQASFTCTVTRTTDNNQFFTASDWMVEAAGVLFFGQNGECKNGQKTKTIVAVGCDGEKQLFSDKVTVDCSSDVVTCLHPIRNDAVVIDHSYSEQEGGTQLRMRTWDIKKKKRVHNLDWGHDGGPDTELLSVKDADNDGIPELIFQQAGSDQVKKVLRWNGKTFAGKK